MSMSGSSKGEFLEKKYLGWLDRCNKILVLVSAPPCMVLTPIFMHWTVNSPTSQMSFILRLPIGLPLEVLDLNTSQVGLTILLPKPDPPSLLPHYSERKLNHSVNQLKNVRIALDYFLHPNPSLPISSLLSQRPLIQPPLVWFAFVPSAPFPLMATALESIHPFQTSLLPQPPNWSL